MTDKVGVAAFDFDGTLTRSDSVVPFLRLVARKPALATRLDRPSARDAEVIAAYGDVVWGASHLSVLVDFDLREVDAERAELERKSDFIHAELAFAMGTVAHGHRALWKMAQSPKANHSASHCAAEPLARPKPAKVTPDRINPPIPMAREPVRSSSAPTGGPPIIWMKPKTVSPR